MDNYLRNLKSLQRYVAFYDTYQEERKEVGEFSGELIRGLREISGVSLRKFAAALNVTPSYLSKVERGVEVISPEMARRLLALHEKA